MARDARECLRSLNWLAGCDRRPLLPVGQMSTDFFQKGNLKQWVVERVIQHVKEHPEIPGTPEPKEAFSGLLRGRGVYDAETACANLATYKHGAVSLPDSIAEAPLLETILPDRARQYLVGFEELMLKSEDEFMMMKEQSPPRLYTDRYLISNRRRYSHFVRQLRDVGLVRFTRTPQEHVGVFFVWKKGRERMRMILDCRRSNGRFVNPPGVDLLSSEGLSRIEVDSAQAVDVATRICLGSADVQDCFHRMRIGPPLCQWFCYPPGSAKEFGMTGQVVDGRALASHDTVWPCAGALPMGWAWSLYFAGGEHALAGAAAGV